VLRVLLIEDSDTDEKLLLRALRANWPDVELHRVEDESAMRAALATDRWDLIICDWALPKFGTLAALELLRSSGLDIPFVIVSGTIGEQAAVQAMRDGACDYVGKNDLGRLVAVVERELREGANRRRLREQREQNERFFNLSLDMMCVVGFDGRFKRVNLAWQHALGWTAEELLSLRWLDLVHPDDLPKTREIIAQLSSHRLDAVPFEGRYRCKDGRYRHLLWSAASFATEEAIYAAARDITDRKEAETALRASEVRYRALFEQSPFPKWVYDEESCHFLAVNDAAVRRYGYSHDEFSAMTVADICPPEEGRSRDRAVSPSDVELDGVFRHRAKDGSTFDAHVTSHPLALEGRRSRLVVARDVTETRKLEDQLRQAQKMEAIGSLAGGIAHDFNNILSVVLSYTSMLLQDGCTDDTVRGDLEEVHKAGMRATELTRQLLAFSRRQVLQPSVVDVGAILRGMEKMLRRLLREDVELDLVLPAEAGTVLVDSSQLEQVIMNLAINARDAMPNGGRLTIAVTHVDVDAPLTQQRPGLALGPHVLLTVADEGTGIDSATRQHIFEPFFTTKGQGQGTGLGLSTVLGIVEQSGGQIWLESEPGHGAAFTVCFPRKDSAGLRPLEASASPMKRGSATVLLVEDEEQVRTLASSILRRQGYQVLEAENGGEALLLCEQHEGSIDILVSDVVMKHINGPQLAERLAAIRPDMRVLFMSGYTDDLIARYGVLSPDVAFLQKPLTPIKLLRKVEDVLLADRPETGAAAARSLLPPPRSATILIVDDDQTMRTLIRRMLASKDFTVFDASSSEEALALIAEKRPTLDLLLTDVVMPRIDGHALASRVLREQPGVRVLYMSGCGLDVVAQYGVAASHDFLPKPFTARALRARIYRALSQLGTA